jgi:hypothetical protein
MGCSIGSNGSIDDIGSEVGVGGIAGRGRLAQDDHAGGDTRSDDFVDRCPWSPSSCNFEEVLGGFVHSEALVVELDVIEIDKRTDLPVDLEVRSLGVLGSL